MSLRFGKIGSDNQQPPPKKKEEGMRSDGEETKTTEGVACINGVALACTANNPFKQQERVRERGREEGEQTKPSHARAEKGSAATDKPTPLSHSLVPLRDELEAAAASSSGSIVSFVIT